MSAIAAMAVMGNAATDAEELAKLKEELSTLKEQVKEIKIHDAGDNIKFSVNMRAAVDALNYETAEGKHYGNANLMTNRLQLGMAAQPAENLTFNGLLSYNKAYGAASQNHSNNNYPQRGYGYDTFDWVINENLTDNTLKVKEASFFYYGDMGVPYVVSVGRRPSTDGLLANHREGASKAKSPLGHSINVEYDGASFMLRDLTDFGTSFKICAGRGLTNARGRFNMDGGLDSYGDYSKDNSAIDSVDMYGVIFVPYDDGQYKLSIMSYHATNLPGFGIAMTDDATPGFDAGTFNFTGNNTGMLNGFSADTPSDYTWGSLMSVMNSMEPQFNGDSTGFHGQMESLGDFDGTAISFQMQGIGEFGVSDFLDDTTFFASYAMSKTTPNNDLKVIDLETFQANTNTAVMQAFQTEYASQLATIAADPANPTATEMQQAQAATMAADASAVFGQIGSSTLPTKDLGMLGSNDSETGSSWWVGLTIPAMFTDDGKIGFEMNHGDKYWRSFTYGEDTMIGSKLAARGTASEVYYNQPLVDQYLTMQIRYTAINYEYTGSQGFFGDEGMPLTMDEAKDMGMDPVESSNDVRFSITYNY